jgi:hypothetical protein
MISFLVAFGLMFQADEALAIAPLPSIQHPPPPEAFRALAVSGSNIYTAWSNDSSTLHGVAVFFTKE